MTNFEKRIKEFTIDTLISIENEMFECNNCYCRLFCEELGSTISCDETRRKWLSQSSPR